MQTTRITHALARGRARAHACVVWHPDLAEARYQSVHIMLWIGLSVSGVVTVLAGLITGGDPINGIVNTLLFGFAAVLVARVPGARPVVSMVLAFSALGWSAHAMLVMQDPPLASTALWVIMTAAAVAERPRRSLVLAGPAVAIVLSVLLVPHEAHPLWGAAETDGFISGALLVLAAMTLGAYKGASAWEQGIGSLRAQVRRNEDLVAEIAAENDLLESLVEERKGELRARHEELSAREEELSRSLAAQQEMSHKMRELSVRDELTSLRNRRFFVASLEEMLSAGQPVSLLIIDVDHFKKINDTFGHPVGDLVLQLLATTLRDALRTDDEVGRLGGEEFGLLLSGTDDRAAIDVVPDPATGGHRRRVAARTGFAPGTVSVGVATAEPGQDGGSLFIAADRALYEAKRTGRDRVVAAAGMSRNAQAVTEHA